MQIKSLLYFCKKKIIIIIIIIIIISIIIISISIIIIRSDEGLTVETSAFRISVRWPIYVINSVDKTKIFVYYFPTDAAPQFL